MKLSVHVDCNHHESPKPEAFEIWVATALSGDHPRWRPTQVAELSIQVVDSDEMTRFNHQYRGKETATNCGRTEQHRRKVLRKKQQSCAVPRRRGVPRPIIEATSGITIIARVAASARATITARIEGTRVAVVTSSGLRIRGGKSATTTREFHAGRVGLDDFGPDWAE